MLRIGEVAEIYGISNRTLRYWEGAGILESYRKENGYRYYDKKNIMRIKQIRLFRKLSLSIQDIQHIFVSEELSTVIEVLTRHMEETNQKTEELKALSVVLKRLIQIVKSQQNLQDVFQYLDIPDNSVVLELKNALQITLSERKITVCQNSSYNNNNVRIISLPKMIVASYSIVSETPENDCWEMVNKLIQQHSLNERASFRHFGFGFNNQKMEYGYEMWVVIPEDFKVSEPFKKKDISGGLYAALPAYLPVIGERWNQLNNWLEESDDYKSDWRPNDNRNYLEECIDYYTFNSKETEKSKKQLDLLLPIMKLKDIDQSQTDVVLELEPKIMELPDIKLGGCFFEQKEKTSLWKKKIPWYKLADNIYKSGKDSMTRIKEGNNTFTLVFGESSTDIPFYILGKQGNVNKCFAAVEITQPFESYPDGLEERRLPKRKYLVFSTWINPDKVGIKKLKSMELYMAAAEYVLRNNCKVDSSFCLERYYRKDGKNVDKIELYVPFVINEN